MGDLGGFLIMVNGITVSGFVALLSYPASWIGSILFVGFLMFVKLRRKQCSLNKKVNYMGIFILLVIIPFFQGCATLNTIENDNSVLPSFSSESDIGAFHAVIRETDESYIFIIDPKLKVIHGLKQYPGSYSPSVSKDGEKIVFIHKCKLGSEIQIYTISTGEIITLELGTALYKAPVFSPDGQSIFFYKAPIDSTGDRTYGWAICKLNLQTKVEEQLTEFTFLDLSILSISSDQKMLAYSYLGVGGKNLMIRNLETKQEWKLLVSDAGSIVFTDKSDFAIVSIIGNVKDYLGEKWSYGFYRWDYQKKSLTPLANRLWYSPGIQIIGKRAIEYYSLSDQSFMLFDLETKKLENLELGDYSIDFSLNNKRNVLSKWLTGKR